ncbi:hypothetical protein [Scytonema millei]|uniref:Uncharacterized protein n=1 Tax=Scytonema millei VB511283 TaxID=1245923 RepID=A0A9X5I5N5_9CYAN|nr:hypothetical protein [Scytonema millei]NHC35894.1 hypothetical protein [Scytonema millei VB511283]
MILIGWRDKREVSKSKVRSQKILHLKSRITDRRSRGSIDKEYVSHVVDRQQPQCRLLF